MVAVTTKPPRNILSFFIRRGSFHPWSFPCYSRSCYVREGTDFFFCNNYVVPKKKQKLSNVLVFSVISEIPEPELKITEPDPKCRNTRTDFIHLYRNTRTSEISDPTVSERPPQIAGKPV